MDGRQRSWSAVAFKPQFRCPSLFPSEITGRIPVISRARGAICEMQKLEAPVLASRAPGNSMVGDALVQSNSSPGIHTRPSLGDNVSQKGVNGAYRWLLLPEDWLPLVDSRCRSGELCSAGASEENYIQHWLGSLLGTFVQLPLHSALIPASD